VSGTPESRIIGRMGELSQAASGTFWKLTVDFLCQSPGSEASTRRAFGMLPALPASARILDCGSGPGRQTFDLASLCSARIEAVDVLPPFIDALRERAEALGLSERIEARVQSMLDVEPPPGGFDLIWCEGAVYNVGFENALRTWRPWLAAGACVGVSEATWMTPSPPAQALAFWDEAYPAMQLHEDNVRTIEACGYELLGSFPQPAGDWRQYYGPREERIRSMRAETNDPDELEALAHFEAEGRLYDESEGAYTYVFYVVRRAEGLRS